MDDKINEKNSLTLKQRRWLKAYIETGNGTEAARRVYDCSSDESAAVISSENLRKLNVSDLLEDIGISDTLLLEKLSEGLSATKTIRYRCSRGKVGSKASIVVPDYPVRHKYLETALKLKNRFPRERHDVTSDGEQVESLIIYKPEKYKE